MKLECSYVQLPKIYSYLTGNEFKVFTVIYDEWTMMKNEDGWFYRSQKMLSEDSGLPLRTLQRTLKKLIEKGVILTTFYNDGVKMATYNKANEYKINLEVVYKLCKKGVKMTTEGCQNGAPSKDIKTKNSNITTGILEHKDLGPTVTEDKENKKEKVNEMKTSTSEDQNKNEVKVSSPKVIPSSKIEDNNTGGKVYIPKNYEVNSPTSPSEDDMTFEEYLEQDLKERGLTPSVGQTQNITSSDYNNTDNKVSIPKVKPSSTETSNKATGEVQSTKMEQLPTNDIKTQPDAKEEAQTEREAKIASIMTNIELDKDGMLKAKNQMQFDASFADFKRNLSNLQHLVSDEAYQNYRSTQVNWWKATVKYLVWYKKPSKKTTKPTVEQMGNYQYHLDSMRIAQKIEDMENALNRMSVWFDKMEALYTKAVMQQYWNKFERDCASVKRSNPIFEEWQKKMSQMA